MKDDLSALVSAHMLRMWHWHAWCASGTLIFSICLVYTTYTPCICRPDRYTWDIHDIFMDIPRISNRVDIRGISMDIHGISFDVYPWYIRGISMDIPSFL